MYGELFILVVTTLFSAGTVALGQAWSAVIALYVQKCVKCIHRTGDRETANETIQRQLKVFEAIFMTIFVLCAIVCIRRYLGPLSVCPIV